MVSWLVCERKRERGVICFRFYFLIFLVSWFVSFSRRCFLVS